MLTLTCYAFNYLQFHFIHDNLLAWPVLSMKGENPLSSQTTSAFLTRKVNTNMAMITNFSMSCWQHWALLNIYLFIYSFQSRRKEKALCFFTSVPVCMRFSQLCHQFPSAHTMASYSFQKWNRIDRVRKMFCVCLHTGPLLIASSERLFRRVESALMLTLGKNPL